MGLRPEPVPGPNCGVVAGVDIGSNGSIDAALLASPITLTSSRGSDFSFHNPGTRCARTCPT